MFNVSTPHIALPNSVNICPAILVTDWIRSLIPILQNELVGGDLHDYASLSLL